MDPAAGRNTTIEGTQDAPTCCAMCYEEESGCLAWYISGGQCCTSPPPALHEGYGVHNKRVNKTQISPRKCSITSQAQNIGDFFNTIGHELPRRLLAGAAAIPTITDTNADAPRFRFGPFASV